jgi:hypothetical protein
MTKNFLVRKNSNDEVELGIVDDGRWITIDGNGIWIFVAKVEIPKLIEGLNTFIEGTKGKFVVREETEYLNRVEIEDNGDSIILKEIDVDEDEYTERCSIFKSDLPKMIRGLKTFI